MYSGDSENKFRTFGLASEEEQKRKEKRQKRTGSYHGAWQHHVTHEMENGSDASRSRHHDLTSMLKIFSSAGFGSSQKPRVPAPYHHSHWSAPVRNRANKGCGSGDPRCESEPDMGEVYIPRGARALFRVCTSRCSFPPFPRSSGLVSRVIPPIQTHARSAFETFLCPPPLFAYLSFVLSVCFRSIQAFASVIIDMVYLSPPGRTDREGQDETIGKRGQRD